MVNISKPLFTDLLQAIAAGVSLSAPQPTNLRTVYLPGPTSTAVATQASTVAAITNLTASGSSSRLGYPRWADCLDFDSHNDKHIVLFEIWGIENWRDNEHAVDNLLAALRENFKPWPDHHLDNYWYGHDESSGEPFVLLSVKEVPKGSIEASIIDAGGPIGLTCRKSGSYKLNELRENGIGPWIGVKDNNNKHDIGGQCIGWNGMGAHCAGKSTSPQERH